MTAKWAMAMLFALPATPAAATDWYHIDASADGDNVSFVDKDGIGTNAAGNRIASVYTVIDSGDAASPAALLFTVEVDCPANRWRMTAMEIFGPDNVSRQKTERTDAWEPPGKDAEAAAIITFICTKGANAPAANAFGSAYPFERARQLLADQAKRKP